MVLSRKLIMREVFMPSILATTSLSGFRVEGEGRLIVVVVFPLHLASCKQEPHSYSVLLIILRFACVCVYITFMSMSLACRVLKDVKSNRCYCRASSTSVILLLYLALSGWGVCQSSLYTTYKRQIIFSLPHIVIAVKTLTCEPVCPEKDSADL